MSELVSIIIPVYNVRDYIIETIESVRAQTYADWEMLLVEDGSTDGTADVVKRCLDERKDPRIRLIPLPENVGAARARNCGVHEARGRYIAFLDSDDLWESEKLAHQLAFLHRHEAAFSFTGYEFADEHGRGTGKVVRVPEQLTYRQALKNTTIFTSTVLFDTERIARTELEMPVIKSEDTALWWRILRGGRIAYGLDENLARYRRAGKSLSSNKIEALRRIWNLYRRAEHLSVPVSAWNFCFWAVNAVARRV